MAEKGTHTVFHLTGHNQVQGHQSPIKNQIVASETSSTPFKKQ